MSFVKIEQKRRVGCIQTHVNTQDNVEISVVNVELKLDTNVLIISHLIFAVGVEKLFVRNVPNVGQWSS